MPIGVHAGRRSADVSLTLEMGSSALLCFVRRSAVWSPDKFLRSVDPVIPLVISLSPPEPSSFLLRLQRTASSPALAERSV